MLKAGALIYAIFISFLIALTSSSVVFLAFANKLNAEQAFTSDRLIRNAKSGLQVLMSSQSLIRTNEEKIFDLFGQGNDSVLLQKRDWGLFDVISSRAFSGRSQNHQIALVGSSGNNKDNIAVYLPDSKDKSLAVCGKTLIKGDCYLPLLGAKKAKIETQEFEGTTLIDGRIRKSGMSLPAFGKDLMLRIQLLEDGHYYFPDSSQDIKLLTLRDSVKQSFSLHTSAYESKNAIVFDKKVIEGNIIIRSGKSITLRGNCHVSNALFYAPKIIIEDGFTGNLQAFASDTLIVGKKCKFDFPSVLAVYRTKTSGKIIRLSMGEEVTCMGILLAVQEGKDPDKRMDVILSKADLVCGQVYSQGTLELQGTVFGSVYTSKFIVHTPSSLYENHLLNAQINVSKLPDEYVGISIEGEKTGENKKIMKWLD